MLPKRDSQRQRHKSKASKSLSSQSPIGNVPLVELAVVLAVSISFYLIASVLDLNERWIDWSAQYEQYELDELPLGFGIIAVAFAWFSWRRWVVLNKTNSELSRIQTSLLVEIRQREKAEKIGADIRQKLEQNILVQKKRAERIQSIQEMGELLIFAQSKPEIFNIAIRYAQKIIPCSSGAIYESYDHSLKHIQGWGKLTNSDFEGTTDYVCWATRQGKSYRETPTPSGQSLCAHATGSQYIICVPILTPRGVWGVLHFRQGHSFAETEQTAKFDNIELESLAKTIADNIGLHIHSLFLKEQLTLESIRDPLTGILNRRGLLKLIQERDLLQNPDSHCSVLLLDIDYFKQLNDQFGHNRDAALVSISELVAKLIRRQDIFCRYGGEEFLLMLINIDKSTALLRAESIRQFVEQHVLKIGSHQVDQLTVSIGVATYPEDADAYEELIQKADKALYRAKELGRNRVVDCAMAG
ncbi:MAG: GGDEF domain-containing protein [Cyanobacteria bacterium J06639_16]